MKRRAPAQIVEILRTAVKRAARGPADPINTGQSDEHLAGMEDERARQARWRDSWLTPELAAIAAYADGRLTVQDITHQTAAYYRVVDEAMEGSES